MADESGERDEAEPWMGVPFQVNWFHVDRPVAGTTFRRQSAPQSVADGDDDPIPG